MHGVKAFGFALAQMLHFGGNDFQTGVFKAGVDFADCVFADGIGFDNGNGAFDGHVVILK